MTLADYNTFQKINVSYFNTGIFKDFLGEKYQLAQLKGSQHLVMRDTVNNINLDSLYIDSDTLQDIGNKMGSQSKEKVIKFIEEVEKDIYPDPTMNYFTKRKNYINNTVIVPLVFEEDEIAFKNSFFLSARGVNYTPNFKEKSIKNLLNEKLYNDSSINTCFYENYEAYYKLINQKFEHTFYPEFKDSKYHFRKNILFLSDELEMRYMPDKLIQGEYTTNRSTIWLAFLKNDNFLGGSCLFNDDATEIRNISIKASQANEFNYRKGIQDILNSDYCKQDVFLMAPEIKAFGFEKSVRTNNENKRIYFNENEKDLYFDLMAFIQKNNFGKYSEKIVDKFYKEIILNSSINQPQSVLFEDDYLSLVVEQFNNKIYTQYANKPKNGLRVDREEIIKQCILHVNGDNTFKYYLKNELDALSFNFTIRRNEHEPADYSPLVDDVFKFLDSYNYILSDEQKNCLVNNIYINNYHGKIYDDSIIEHGYSFHALYDFLSTQDLVKKSNLTYVYRLEFSDGTGIYRSVSNQSLLDDSLVDILEYSQRTYPSKEKGISSLFDIKNFHEKMSHNFYNENYYFAFKNLNQLKDWFKPNELLNFMKNDVKIIRYEIEENYIISTASQVAFNKRFVNDKKELNFKECLDINETSKIHSKMKPN